MKCPEFKAALKKARMEEKSKNTPMPKKTTDTAKITEILDRSDMKESYVNEFHSDIMEFDNRARERQSIIENIDSEKLIFYSTYCIFTQPFICK